MLVAVYGTLRKGQSNYKYHLEDADYLGEFQSEPIYNLYNINNVFPGLKKGGQTSITMEVYDIDEAILEGIDRLEGYNKDRDTNHYTRSTIVTPYGPAFTYFYESVIVDDEIIDSGDWIEYEAVNKIKRYV